MDSQQRKPKNRIVVIIAIIAIVAIVAFAAIFIISKLSKSTIGGTYIFDKYKDSGVTMELTIDKDSYSLDSICNGEKSSMTGNFELREDLVYLDGSEAGTYDSKKDIIIIGTQEFHK